jgi:hypothetical protein
MCARVPSDMDHAWSRPCHSHILRLDSWDQCSRTCIDPLAGDSSKELFNFFKQFFTEWNVIFQLLFKISFFFWLDSFTWFSFPNRLLVSLYHVERRTDWPNVSSPGNINMPKKNWNCIEHRSQGRRCWSSINNERVVLQVHTTPESSHSLSFVPTLPKIWYAFSTIN